MNRPSHSPDDVFAGWLDSGRPAVPETGSHAETNHDLLAARDAAILLDALNQGLEHQAIVTAPRRTPFEAILDAAAPASTLGMPNRSSFTKKGPDMDGYLSPPVAPVRPFRPPVRMAANRIVTLAAVVAILCATAGAAWMQRDRLGFGGGNDGPEPVDYGSFVLPDWQEESPHDLPAPEDCTVEPLTVDEVMAKLEEPYYWPEQSDAKETVIAMLESGTPLPQPELEHDYTLPEPTYEDVAAVQRAWVACALYGTPFQRWALETPVRMQDEFRRLYMPVFDMGLIRQDLVDLTAGSENRLSAPALMESSTLPVVADPANGGNDIRLSEDRAIITVDWIRPDGSSVYDFSSQAAIDRFMAAPGIEQQLPNAWTFERNTSTGQWQLSDMRYSGG